LPGSVLIDAQRACANRTAFSGGPIRKPDHEQFPCEAGEDNLRLQQLRAAATKGAPAYDVQGQRSGNETNRNNFASATMLASLAFAPLAHADIVIGLIAPLTGPVAAYGEQVRNGAQVAVEEINKAGGINGEQIVLKVTDDAGEPKQGVSAANQLVGEGVRFVVGPVTSGVAMPASDVLAENGILMVTPTATAPDLTNR